MALSISAHVGFLATAIVLTISGCFSNSVLTSSPMVSSNFSLTLSNTNVVGTAFNATNSNISPTHISNFGATETTKNSENTFPMPSPSRSESPASTMQSLQSTSLNATLFSVVPSSTPSCTSGRCNGAPQGTSFGKTTVITAVIVSTLYRIAYQDTFFG